MPFNAFVALTESTVTFDASKSWIPFCIEEPLTWRFRTITWAVVARRRTPAADTALITHPSMTYGLAPVPVPPVTPFAAVKFASESMKIGPWGVRERTATEDDAAVVGIAERRRIRASARPWPPKRTPIPLSPFAERRITLVLS